MFNLKNCQRNKLSKKSKSEKLKWQKAQLSKKSIGEKIVEQNIRKSQRSPTGSLKTNRIFHLVLSESQNMAFSDTI